MFPGTSCFPLSPSSDGAKAKNIVSRCDQMVVILETIGTQSIDDLSFISDP